MLTGVLVHPLGEAVVHGAGTGFERRVPCDRDRVRLPACEVTADRIAARETPVDTSAPHDAHGDVASSLPKN